MAWREGEVDDIVCPDSDGVVVAMYARVSQGTRPRTSDCFWLLRYTYIFLRVVAHGRGLLTAEGTTTKKCRGS